MRWNKKEMLSVIAAQNRNSPAQVVQKYARRLIIIIFLSFFLPSVVKILLLLLGYYCYLFTLLLLCYKCEVSYLASVSQQLSCRPVVMFQVSSSAAWLHFPIKSKQQRNLLTDYNVLY